MSDITNLIEKFNKNKSVYVGYPTATDFNNSLCFPLLNEHINNIGDPFKDTSCFSSFSHEKEVIKFFMKLYKTNINDSWGYVASCSTEAIMFACWKYREFSNKKVVILSAEYSHYCVDKIASILDIDNFRIESNCDGSVNTDKLKEFINNYNKDVSYIFLATLGSTITSSIDDVKSIKSIFNELNKESYIHLDGALDGAFLPLVDNYQLGNYFNSVNISGHKFLGSPVPSGILIIEKKYVSKRYIEYINNDDITIGGSRNGLSPILIYHTIQSLKSEKGILEKYKSCLNKANSFLKKLNENSINAWKNDKAITIVLEHIPDIIFKKWHLPKYQNRSTLTCLPKFTEPMLMELIHDIKNHNQVYPNVSKCFNYQVESL